MALLRAATVIAGLTAIFVASTSSQAEAADKKLASSNSQKCLPAKNVSDLVGKIVRANDEPDNMDFDHLYAIKSITRMDRLKVTGQTRETTGDGKVRTELKFVSANGIEAYGFARRFVVCPQDNKHADQIKTALGDTPAAPAP